jgi:hypothetical protein
LIVVNVVIQCAKSKSGAKWHDADGCPVNFVADPDLAFASRGERERYAHPDSIANDGRTWRQQIIDYNRHATNEHGLSFAYQLYTNPTYRNLVAHYGVEHVFILSAGWGLIPANFLTPYYDITFTKNRNVPEWAVRRGYGGFNDLNYLPNESDEPLVFLGGKAYVELFARLARRYNGPKIVVHSSRDQPTLDGQCVTVRYRGTTQTNWHYACAQDMIRGVFDPIAKAGL